MAVINLVLVNKVRLWGKEHKVSPPMQLTPSGWEELDAIRVSEPSRFVQTLAAMGFTLTPIKRVQEQ